MLHNFLRLVWRAEGVSGAYGDCTLGARRIFFFGKFGTEASGFGVIFFRPDVEFHGAGGCINRALLKFHQPVSDHDCTSRW
jgi:hypothetical protein